MRFLMRSMSFLSTLPTTPGISTLSLHDALPICVLLVVCLDPLVDDECHYSILPKRTQPLWPPRPIAFESATSTCSRRARSEEHTSELQSRPHLVCRLLLEKKNTHERVNTSGLLR